jgi:hypothetical protein
MFAQSETERLGWEHDSGYAFPLLPFWLAPAHIERIAADLGAVVDIVLRLGDLRFGGDCHAWAAHLGLDAATITAMRPFFGRPLGPLIARPDGFLTEASVRICELNIDSGISGFAGLHARAAYFSGHPQIAAALQAAGFTQRVLSPVPAWQRIIDALPKPVWLMDNWAGDSPRMRRLNDAERELACAAGEDVLSTVPEEVAVADGVLLVDGRRVRSAFRVIADQTLAAERDRFARVLAALAADRSCTFVAPPTTSLLENKINLALLRDPPVQERLDAAERAAIERVIPSTYRLDEAVADRAASKPGAWVLKRANSKSARDVCIGRDQGRDGFHRALRRGVAEGDWVAQAFIEPRPMETLYLVEDTLVPLACPVMARVFVLDGRVEGLDCEAGVWDPEAGSFRNAPGYGAVGRSLFALAEPAGEGTRHSENEVRLHEALLPHIGHQRVRGSHQHSGELAAHHVAAQDGMDDPRQRRKRRGDPARVRVNALLHDVVARHVAAAGHDPLAP